MVCIPKRFGLLPFPFSLSMSIRCKLSLFPIALRLARLLAIISFERSEPLPERIRAIFGACVVSLCDNVLKTGRSIISFVIPHM
jgi:hypothetical protein